MLQHLPHHRCDCGEICGSVQTSSLQVHYIVINQKIVLCHSCSSKCKQSKFEQESVLT